LELESCEQQAQRTLFLILCNRCIGLHRTHGIQSSKVPGLKEPVEELTNVEADSTLLVLGEGFEEVGRTVMFDGDTFWLLGWFYLKRS
jgi:hypothetical protein